MNYFNSNFGMGMSAGPASFLNALGPSILLLVVWSLFWKGLALWHSGRKGQEWWFIIMLVVNTAGLLEIVYLFLILKLKFNELFSKKA